MALGGLPPTWRDKDFGKLLFIPFSTGGSVYLNELVAGVHVLFGLNDHLIIVSSPLHEADVKVCSNAIADCSKSIR